MQFVLFPESFLFESPERMLELVLCPLIPTQLHIEQRQACLTCTQCTGVHIQLNITADKH